MIALILAVPIAVGVALFISHYAPRWLPRCRLIVDLLAAVPTIVFGLWGFADPRPTIAFPRHGLRQFLEDDLVWFPLFQGRRRISAGQSFSSRRSSWRS